MPAASKRAPTKKSKAKKRLKPVPTHPVLTKTAIKWEDAYPYIEETYKFGKEVYTTTKYLSSANKAEMEDFLYKIIRSNNYPVFLKANFKKIKKLVEREISHRDKLYEKLTKEQVIAFQSYFRDDTYFERDDSDEYFQHELEKVYFDYLKAYLETGLYESRARSHNRIRRQFLQEHGIG